MNGRVYDPTLGKFLSANPFVGDAQPGNCSTGTAMSFVCALRDID